MAAVIVARATPTPRPSNEDVPVITTPDETDAAVLYSIECRRNSVVDGATFLKQCKITQTSGPAERVKPVQHHIGNINIDGVAPYGDGEAKDIHQTGTLNSAPYGAIYTVHPSNMTTVNKQP